MAAFSSVFGRTPTLIIKMIAMYKSEANIATCMKASVAASVQLVLCSRLNRVRLFMHVSTLALASLLWQKHSSMH